MKIPFFARQYNNNDFSKAFRRIFWGQRQQKHKSKCADLVPTSELWSNLKRYKSRALGVQNIPADRIVGSSRSRDFDLHFKPKRDQVSRRTKAITSLPLKGRSLSPPIVLKVENSYFVEDGNHRISAARGAGNEHILAWVTELEIERLRMEPSCSRLGFRLKSAAGGCDNQEALTCS